MTITRYGDIYRFDAQPWAPTRLTPPLTEGAFLSDGPRLIALVERHYRVASDSAAEGSLMVLDDWQRALLCHVLERYPLDWHVERLRGRLRFRQVVISMGRQNGKSLLGAIFALYGLLQHVAGPNVISVAKSVEQANVVYSRVEFAVRRDPDLIKRLSPSGTRGIKRRDFTGIYEVKPSLEEGLQSVPITLCVADELHLSRPAMWDSIVQGQRAQLDALVVGITTAGDAKSKLLKRLYERGDREIDAEQPGRFGFFVWEAPEGATLDTPGALEAANPSVACGRVDRETAIDDLRDQPEPDIQRYALNRFVASSTQWLAMRDWRPLGGRRLEPTPTDLVVGITRTDAWQYATIAAATKDHSAATITTELLASLVKPNLDQVVAIAADLAGRYPCTFVVRSEQSDIGKALRTAGHDVWILTQNEYAQASARLQSAVARRAVHHANDALVTAQLPLTRKAGAGRLWYADGGDAVTATILAVHIADTKPERTEQLF